MCSVNINYSVVHYTCQFKILTGFLNVLWFVLSVFLNTATNVMSSVK